MLRMLGPSLRSKRNVQHELLPRPELDIGFVGCDLHLLSVFEPFLIDVSAKTGFIFGDPGPDLGGLLKPEDRARVQIGLQSQTPSSRKGATHGGPFVDRIGKYL